MNELVFSNDAGSSMSVASSPHPAALARIAIERFGQTAYADLRPETVDRLILELAIIKHREATGGYDFA